MLRQSLREVYATPGRNISNRNTVVLYLTVFVFDEEIIMHAVRLNLRKYGLSSQFTGVTSNQIHKACAVTK